jgi:hypothetical protein
LYRPVRLSLSAKSVKFFFSQQISKHYQPNEQGVGGTTYKMSCVLSCLVYSKFKKKILTLCIEQSSFVSLISIYVNNFYNDLCLWVTLVVSNFRL